jgi:UDP-glucose 4-epimerase
VRVLVTGGAGYLGSVCAAHLVESGYEVIVLDDLSTGHRDAVPDGCRFVEGDVACDADPILADGVDGVLHFAAKSLVGESMAHPERYWSGNVVATFGLLEAMRRHGTPILVFSSTAATYGEPAEMPITEDAPAMPTNTYGATKLAIDHAIAGYASAHGLAAVSLRYFNVAGAHGNYGERHAVETHLIPIVLQVASGLRAEVQIYGEDWPTPDGSCIRDYIHVDDLAEAHVLALHYATPKQHRVYNLGSGTGFSVREVIEACRAVTGHPLPATVAPRRRGDPAVLIASSERARAELGWRPSRTDLTQIVGDAWEFTQHLGSGKSAALAHRSSSDACSSPAARCAPSVHHPTI